MNYLLLALLVISVHERGSRSVRRQFERADRKCHCRYSERLRRRLDHGSADLQAFVAAGLIYRTEVNPDFEAMLRFYQRPGWPKILRRFANTDEDESSVLADLLEAVHDLVRRVGLPIDQRPEPLWQHVVSR